MNKTFDRMKVPISQKETGDRRIIKFRKKFLQTTKETGQNQTQKKSFIKLLIKESSQNLESYNTWEETTH